MSGPSASFADIDTNTADMILRGETDPAHHPAAARAIGLYAARNHLPDTETGQLLEMLGVPRWCGSAGNVPA